jgi:hypothetical protein
LGASAAVAFPRAEAPAGFALAATRDVGAPVNVMPARFAASRALGVTTADVASSSRAPLRAA